MRPDAAFQQLRRRSLFAIVEDRPTSETLDLIRRAGTPRKPRQRLSAKAKSSPKKGDVAQLCRREHYDAAFFFLAFFFLGAATAAFGAAGAFGAAALAPFFFFSSSEPRRGLHPAGVATAAVGSAAPSSWPRPEPPWAWPSSPASQQRRRLQPASSRSVSLSS